VNADKEDRKRAEALLEGEKQLLEMVASGRPLLVVPTLCAGCSTPRPVRESCTPGSVRRVLSNGHSYRDIMNGKHQENGTLSGPLILALPASNFVAILRPEWLDGTDQTAVPAKAHGWELGLAPTAPRRTGPERNPSRVIGKIKRVFRSAVLMIFGKRTACLLGL
jgi:hypothetical protein